MDLGGVLRGSVPMVAKYAVYVSSGVPMWVIKCDKVPSGVPLLWEKNVMKCPLLYVPYISEKC